MFTVIKLSFLFAVGRKPPINHSFLYLCRSFSVTELNRNVRMCFVRTRSNFVFPRFLHTTRSLLETESKKKDAETAVMRFQDFELRDDKNKESYLDLIRLYEGRHQQRRGHVEFIYVALKHMTEFGVDKDLAVYKTLLNVLPKGRFIPTNMFQVEFMHYPKQQQVAIDLLEKMEDNGVIPDAEMEDILLNIFGNKGHPLRKYWRMMYWMPKFKNLSPWPVPKPPPQNLILLARLAIQRICSVDLQSQIHEWEAKEVTDSIDKTWIVSGQSPSQRELLEEHKKTGQPVIVEGGDRVWLRNKSVSYYVLKSDPGKLEEYVPPDLDDVGNIKVPHFKIKFSSEVERVKTVHEQDDGTIFAVCATGTSSKDSLLSWIRLLQEHENPVLSDLPVLFRFKKPSGDLVPFSEALATNKQSDET